MECFIESCLYPAPVSGKGRGVFSRRPLGGQLLIEVSPVIVIAAPDESLIQVSVLRNYFFGWEPAGAIMQRCLALGYISLYNHSYHANCRYEKHTDAQTISIHTLRPIAAGEELTINYNGIPDGATPVWWFEATD